jgi:hypothetical protein
VTDASPGDGWDVVIRPKRTPLFAYAVAAVIAIVGIVAAVPLKQSHSGAFLRTADQFAIAGLALVLAGAVLLWTRPRLKVGPAGLVVRNVLDDRMIPWTDVVDISFPRGKRWARVNLEHDEYIPVLAIQTADRERAVDAMETVRALMERYRPD